MLKTVDHLAELTIIFAPLKMDFVFDSMAAGLTPARAFEGEGETPATIVWEGHSIYFGGGDNEPDLCRQAAGLFAEHILTPAKRAELVGAKLIFTSDVWKDALLEAFQKSEPGVYGRVLLRHALQIFPQPPALPEGYQIKAISEPLLNSSLENCESIIQEVSEMWGSTQRFLQSGFGVCAIQNSTIVGWCTAEYVGRNACGIGIETFEAHQKQGIGTAMTAEMVEKCRQLGKTPHWDSWKRNTASVRVAEKCGFEKVNEYDVILVRF